ncbi:MAG TPA: hypothetical protein VN544_10780 [Gaiellaceae bacterium]|nr:hypothetical protein [Gaiellaceae bacterium]
MSRRLRQVVRAWRRPTRASQQEQALRARVERLESVVEGLQDAVYRQAQQHDRDLEELRRRTEPTEIARALSEDARRRGL